MFLLGHKYNEIMALIKTCNKMLFYVIKVFDKSFPVSFKITSYFDFNKNQQVFLLRNEKAIVQQRL